MGTFERRSLFTNPELVAAVLTQILRASTRCGFEVIAYCFMPDHLHLCVHGVTEEASLCAFVKRAKQLSGFHGKLLISGSVWQTGYYERVLRDREDTRTVVGYILANPVRAKIAQAAGEYAYSGSGVLTLPELIESVQLRP